MMLKNLEHIQSISTYHQRQHELVNFLYDRFTVGMIFTLIVSLVASVMVFYELSFQGREYWVLAWLTAIFLFQYLRFRLKAAYDVIKSSEYHTHVLWKRRFVFGIFVVGFWQGFGALLVMPYISDNLQFIIHIFLLGLGAGAIAYLATSMLIYASYLILMILPVTLYQFSLGTIDGFVLGLMQLFMIGAYFFGVKRMNWMISESLHLRFDNELLVNDLQRLLSAVAKSNKELDQISTTDDLTSASNYRAFRVRLEEYRRKHSTSRLPLSVVKINIDFYHEYNAFYGQEIGNSTLVTVAQIIMGEVSQEGEIVARLNGAEFGIILPEVSCEGARIRMESIIKTVESHAIPHPESKVGNILTLSMGICCMPINESVSARELIMRADNALRESKKKGRNNIELIRD